jgi:hypothetical protein
MAAFVQYEHPDKALDFLEKDPRSSIALSSCIDFFRM